MRLLPDADLEVKLQDNQWASLVCGRSRTRIAGMSRESFPELPQMPDVLAQIPVGVLASMISQNHFRDLDGRVALHAERIAAAFEEQRPGDGGDGWASAGDGGASNRPARRHQPVSRAAAAQSDGRDFEAGAGSRTRTPRWQFSGDENHLFFQFGERLLLSRKLTGNFPDFERVLPKDHPHSVVLEREELRKSIERVSQFSDERSRAIRMRVQEGELHIHSSLSETGESEESLPAEYDGDAGRDWIQRRLPAGFSAGVTTRQSIVSFQGRQQRRRAAARRGGRSRIQVPLRRDADAHLKIQAAGQRVSRQARRIEF